MMIFFLIVSPASLVLTGAKITIKNVLKKKLKNYILMNSGIIPADGSYLYLTVIFTITQMRSASLGTKLKSSGCHVTLLSVRIWRYDAHSNRGVTIQYVELKEHALKSDNKNNE